MRVHPSVTLGAGEAALIGAATGEQRTQTSGAAVTAARAEGLREDRE
jgi:hypothetical protein